MHGDTEREELLLSIADIFDGKYVTCVLLEVTYMWIWLGDTHNILRQNSIRSIRFGWPAAKDFSSKWYSASSGDTCVEHFVAWRDMHAP